MELTLQIPDELVAHLVQIGMVDTQDGVRDKKVEARGGFGEKSRRNPVLPVGFKASVQEGATESNDRVCSWKGPEHS